MIFFDQYYHCMGVQNHPYSILLVKIDTLQHDARLKFTLCYMITEVCEKGKSLSGLFTRWSLTRKANCL